MQLTFKDSDIVNRALVEYTHDGGLELLRLINGIINKWSNGKGIGSKGRVYLECGSNWDFSATRFFPVINGGFKAVFKLTGKNTAIVKLEHIEGFEHEII